VVRRGGGELGGTGVHGLVDRPDAEAPAQHPDAVLTGQLRPQRGDLPVRQAEPLGPAQQFRSEGRRVVDGVAHLVDQRDLVDEPRVEAAGLGHLLDRRTGRQRLLGEVEPAVDRHAELLEELVGVGVRILAPGPEAGELRLRRPHRLAQRLGEVPAERHDLADALHRRGQPGVCAGELLEGEPRDLHDDVVQ
jgi:hypothetical protein